MRRGRDEGGAIASMNQPKQFVPLNMAVLTISDTRTLADDKSGTTLGDRITAAGKIVAGRESVTDEVKASLDMAGGWTAEPVFHVPGATGGMGFTGRDVPRKSIQTFF